ncbi:unnamed protein product [Miscanthus lutarioriparius]|uniref:xyloglucan:xyloglucosyl transferase n=1 Tax=Miscanthus lutarioriparius TaxID=422564 RepID=A0A811R739_9POAL|nr:unnamed protein product [Miscanthus lutarioriparius]
MNVGNREQQFRLWFDPTKDFYTYSVEWTPKNIIFLIDGTAIRVYKHEPSRGGTFPTQRHMRRDGSLWYADDWATQGGRVKTDWTHAPFYAYYRNLRVTPCAPSSSPAGVALCSDEAPASAALQKVRAEHLLYGYCEDQNRFKDTGLPKECTAD